MNSKKEEIATFLEQYSDLLPSYRIPLWEDLPSIDLYMDQVIEIVNNRLDTPDLLLPENSEVTRPMINNYVKLKIMPAPEKKKYSKKHLAYIIIICTLKQTLNISTIQKLLPLSLSDEEVHIVYNSFVTNQQKAFNYVYNQLKETAKPILSAEGTNDERINDFILQIASSANILKCISEKIIGREKTE